MVSFDRGFILATLEDAIRIDSRNPGLVATGPGERELARYVEGRLAEIDGWNTTLYDLGDRRANLVAVRAGTGGGRSLMINVHLDTVGVEGMDNPFLPEQRNGRVHGRGALDTKGGLAAVLGAARAMSEGGVALRGDLVLAFVADEEHESSGTVDLVGRMRTDAAIVVEPTDLDVCVAHRGFGVFRLRTLGRSAHGGRSDVGIDANLHMGRVLSELDRLRRDWEHEHRHPMLGTAALHVPLMRGGRGLYMYAAECVADLECRTVPGQTADQVLNELRGLLDTLTGRVEGFAASVEPVLWRSPYEIEPDRAIVEAALDATRQVRGEEPRIIGHPWWEDSGLLGEAGVDAVILGPRGEGLHTEEEWVDLGSVAQLADILYRTALSYCGCG